MKQYVIELTYRSGVKLFYGSIDSRQLMVCHESNAAHYKSIKEAQVFSGPLSNFKPVIRVVEDGVLTGEVVV